VRANSKLMMGVDVVKERPLGYRKTYLESCISTPPLSRWEGGWILVLGI
jgi:hypothetical protein